jgi:hypothetical protein
MGMLSLEKTPPFRVVAAEVSRSVPESCVSGLEGQLAGRSWWRGHDGRRHCRMPARRGGHQDRP